MDDTRTSHQEPLLRSSLKKPREAPSSSSEITGDISRMLCNLLRQQSAPDVDIPVFTGNPLEYHYFMSSFKEAVECKIDDPHGRLVHLLKFTDGEAKETIQHCIQQSPEVGYRLRRALWKPTSNNGCISQSDQKLGTIEARRFSCILEILQLPHQILQMYFAAQYPNYLGIQGTDGTDKY